jgi:thiamine kinase-like enzyme
MSNTPLKGAAHQIDSRLNNASFQTLVHGDAKLANFCFSDNQDKDIAAIDFQYVGRGAGIKRLFTQCDELVDYYFASLHQAISRQNIDIDAKAIEQEWRALCSFAWADFERFLQGWAPGHKKMTKYSALQCELALQQL